MRFSLRIRMVLVTLLILLTGSTCALYYSYISSRKIITNEVGAYLTKESTMAKHFLEEWLSYAANNVLAWSSTPAFIDAITETGYYGKRAIEESNQRLQGFTVKYEQFTRVHIYNLDGELVASSLSFDDLKGIRTNVHDRIYFQISAEGKVHISKILKSRYTQERLCLISAPIKKNEKIVGVVVGAIEVESMLGVLRDLNKTSKNTKIYLLDSNDLSIVSSCREEGCKKSKAFNNVNFKNILDCLHREPSPSQNQPATSPLYCKDEQYIYVSSPIKYNNWKIVVVSLFDNIETTIKTILNSNTAAVIATFIFIALTLSLIYNKYMFSRLVQLREKIQLLEQGDLSSRIQPDNRNDEISSLTDSFNKMASQLQKSIASLRDSREQFQVAVDGSNDGIWDWDITNDNLYLSPRCHSQIGYKENELESATYTSFTKLLHKEDFTRVHEYIQNFLAGKIKGKFDIEFRLLHKDGSDRWIRSRATMLRDNNGTPYRLAGAHTDTTHQHFIEEQLVKAKEEAERSNRYKSEFLANMSHEIRTPIGFITGLCYMIKDTKLDKNQTDFVDKIQRSAHSLLAIVNDILDFSKIEAGRLEVDIQTVNIPHLLSSIAETFTMAAKEKEIELHLDISPHIPDCLKSDPLRLNQIFTNLLSNAIKFTRKGDIFITARCLGKSSDSVKLEVTIRDTGIGMNKKQQERIFKPFSQADASIAKKFGGTGLGLVISHDLLQLLGGDISVKSEPDKGSEFTVTLELATETSSPAASDTQSAPGKTVPPIPLQETAHYPDAKVLLVEDNKINIMIAESLLAKKEITPDTAHNGEEALAAVQQKEYDLVLMDVQMPVMDGYTSTRKIRELKEEKYTTLPIIAMTANAMKQDREKAISSGMNDHLSKPIEPEEFYRLLQKWLKNR